MLKYAEYVKYEAAEIESYAFPLSWGVNYGIEVALWHISKRGRTFYEAFALTSLTGYFVLVW